MISNGGMRASDSDREMTVEVLRDAYAIGRLDLGEFTERTDTAYSARSWQELYDLVADLPAGSFLFSRRPENGSYYEVVKLYYAPRRQSTPIWIMAITGLVISAAAPMAVAIPLLILSLSVVLFMLWGGQAKVPLVWKFRHHTGDGGPSRAEQSPG